MGAIITYCLQPEGYCFGKCEPQTNTRYTDDCNRFECSPSLPGCFQIKIANVESALVTSNADRAPLWRVDPEFSVETLLRQSSASGALSNVECY